MKISILTPQHFLSSDWSGGSSTQLYISPADATFAERNFELRLSTAKVETEESTFTPLPGVHRKLMILEGEIDITHNDQKSKRLNQFDVTEFSGDWKTTSIGTCIDFNVMTAANQQSELYHLSLKAVNNFNLKLKKSCENLFLFATSGKVQLQLNQVHYTLESGNLMIIENLSESSILIDSSEDFGLVILEM